MKQIKKVLRDFGLIFYEGEYVSLFRVAFVFSLIGSFVKPCAETVGLVGICASACLGNKKIPNKLGGDENDD